MKMNRYMPPGQNIWDFNGHYLTRKGLRQKRNLKGSNGGGEKVASNKNTREHDKYTKSEKFQTIQKDLLDQLDRNGTVGEFYIDLVDDYMDMWITKTLLKEDIRARGIKIRYDNGGGQKGWKKNDSVDQKRQVNTQMLKLLSELGIKPAVGVEEDEL